MANRLFKRPRTLDEEVINLTGKVTINSSAAVVTKTGRGFSIAKTGTGAYTITLEDVYPVLLSAHCQLLAATAVDLVPQIVSETVSTTKLIVVKLLAAAVATDPSAACTLMIDLKLKNSALAS
jgi:formylmethanofuran dehydrogenase subunit A